MKWIANPTLFTKRIDGLVKAVFYVFMVTVVTRVEAISTASELGRQPNWASHLITALGIFTMAGGALAGIGYIVAGAYERALFLGGVYIVLSTNLPGILTTEQLTASAAVGLGVFVLSILVLFTVNIAEAFRDAAAHKARRLAREATQQDAESLHTSWVMRQWDAFCSREQSEPSKNDPWTDLTSKKSHTVT